MMMMMLLMMMLLFKRSEYDDDDVVDRKVKVLKMMLSVKRLMLLKIEDEDYMMLKSFQ